MHSRCVRTTRTTLAADHADLASALLPPATVVAAAMRRAAFLRGLEASAARRLAHSPFLDHINRSPPSPYRLRGPCRSDGYVPASPSSLTASAADRFPTTITIRPAHQLDYLPEPDIFHDVAGHVPLHTDPCLRLRPRTLRRMRRHRSRTSPKPSPASSGSPSSSA